MMGHIVEWYYNGIAGIQAMEPGFKRVKICPYLPESVHEFQCSYKSAAGEITVHVKEEKAEIRLHINVPKDIECKIDTVNLENSREGLKKVIVEV